MDGEAWWATAHGVFKEPDTTKQLHFHKEGDIEGEAEHMRDFSNVPQALERLMEGCWVSMREGYILCGSLEPSKMGIKDMMGPPRMVPKQITGHWALYILVKFLIRQLLFF